MTSYSELSLTRVAVSALSQRRFSSVPLAVSFSGGAIQIMSWGEDTEGLARYQARFAAAGAGRITSGSSRRRREQNTSRTWLHGLHCNVATDLGGSVVVRISPRQLRDSGRLVLSGLAATNTMLPPGFLNATFAGAARVSPARGVSCAARPSLGRGLRRGRA